MKNILTLILTLYISNIFVYGQNTTNSPTSMFGLGELSTGEGGQYAGMGGAGIALRGTNFLNSANPSSLTELNNQRFVIDAGIMGAYKSYSQTGVTNNSLVGNLNNFGIAFRIIPRWYGAVFMAPVSSVGYAITLNQDVTGTDGETISSLFEGEGGLSKMGFSTAWLFGKYVSVGANLSYVTGTIKQTETQGTTTVEESSYKHTFYADFGVQYKIPVGREKSLVLGAVYGYSQDFTQDDNLSVSSGSGSGTVDESLHHSRQCMPQFAGAGISYNSPRWTVTTDYKYIDWSRMKSSQANIQFKNQHRIMAGAGYLVGNLYNNPVKILLGAGIGNSYITIQKKESKNYYISTGANFTLKNSSILSFGLKYNNQFKVTNGMQREKGISLFLNLSFPERTHRAKLQ